MRVALFVSLALSIATNVQARSLRSEATECIAFGGTATAWDATTSCSDYYVGFVNSDARITEGSASVKVTTTADAVSTFEECASKCFLKKKCQWFKVTSNADGSSKKCSYYQHLALSQATSSSTATTVNQFGFLLSSDGDYLNQNIQDKTGVYQLGGYNFYKTLDSSSKTISMYISSASAVCAAVPLTLYRAFAIGYQTASMLEKVAAGTIINSMDAKFTLDGFTTALKLGTDHVFSIPTDDVEINSSGNVVRTGKAGTTYEYRLDTSGRVTRVKGRFTYDNLLRKPGDPSSNSAGTTIRNQYCVAAYQQRYNIIQQLTDATSAKMPFQAGHNVGCQFSNANGFFNFVPQSANSNALNGCWYNTELSTARLLKMGCQGDYQVLNKYFSKQGDISEISSLTGPLLDATAAASFYSNTGSSSTLAVQKPCGFFYRPVKMSLDFTITGADSASRCALPLDTIINNAGKFYTVAASTASMIITRAFAQWAYETPQFYRLRGMATADFRMNQCYAETGTLLSKMTFTSDFDRVFLKIKSSTVTSVSTATCVSVNSVGSLQVGACDTASSAYRWTAPVSTIMTNGATKCIRTTADATCVTPEFRYVKSSVTFSGTTADVTSGDQLVDGQVYVGTKCLVQTGTVLSFAVSTSCLTLQATYALDTSTIDSDDD
uniref:Apple domain-containing protein n=1 Tax=Globisporangium ultimum (strain ATCC 200006 / CBS 805.95 / DAOM BR144) TaxID=431595 RepID=K3WWN3_GLOUD